MTKYRQEEYLAFLEDRPIVTDVKVCTNRQEPPDMLTDRELVEVTAVFRAFETGLREATIYPKDLDKAMQALGLNPIEQDVIDLTIKVARDGFIYFPDFCEVILEKYRLGKEGDEHFRQNLFKNLCGTEPFPTDFKAKKYRFDKHFLTKEEFKFVMKNLPAEVHDSEIEEMFAFADKDKDGKLSYEEFQIMINPPAPPEIPKPTLEEFNDFLARKALQEEQQENIQGGSNEYLAPSEQPINIFSMLSQYNPMNRPLSPSGESTFQSARSCRTVSPEPSEGNGGAKPKILSKNAPSIIPPSRGGTGAVGGGNGGQPPQSWALTSILKPSTNTVVQQASSIRSEPQSQMHGEQTDRSGATSRASTTTVRLKNTRVGAATNV